MKPEFFSAAGSHFFLQWFDSMNHGIRQMSHHTNKYAIENERWGQKIWCQPFSPTFLLSTLTGMLPIIYNAWFFDLFIFHRDTGCGRYGSGVIDYERDTRMLVCGVERKIRMGLTLFLWGVFFCWHFKSYYLDILVLGHECIWIRLTSSKSEIFMTYPMMIIAPTSIGCLWSLFETWVTNR